jgi:hypothetical protein
MQAAFAHFLMLAFAVLMAKLGWYMAHNWLIIPREPYASSPSELSLHLVTNLVSFGAELLVGSLLLAAAWGCSFTSS